MERGKNGIRTNERQGGKRGGEIRENTRGKESFREQGRC